MLQYYDIGDNDNNDYPLGIISAPTDIADYDERHSPAVHGQLLPAEGRSCPGLHWTVHPSVRRLSLSLSLSLSVGALYIDAFFLSLVRSFIRPSIHADMAR